MTAVAVGGDGDDGGDEYQGTDRKVIAELARVHAENGDALTPRRIVEAAADPASPLHARFEWNDGVAADNYRLVQAGMLIRQVKRIIVEGERRTIVPRYVSVVDAEGVRVRVESKRAVADPEMLGQVLAETRAMLRGARNRLSAFESARDLVARLDGILGDLPPD